MTTQYKFEKPKNSSLRNQVYDAIRDAIVNKHLKAGDRLRENEISEQMGISRGPIREALRQLEQDGFVISHPYRETRVAEISSEVVESVYVPIRRTIELYAAKKARTVLSDEDFSNLEDILRDMNRASQKEDLIRISELDFKFHQYFVNYAGGHGLLTIWNSVMNRIYSRFIVQGVRHPTLSDVVTEHTDFLEILRKGDEKEIEAHLAAHIT